MVDLQELKVLVIEDNYGDFVLIEEYLGDEYTNLQVSRAESFKESKSLLENDICFDAVLLDLSLPDVDDTEFLVKNIINSSNGAAVIVLTGYSNKSFGIKALSWGVSDYLLKDEINASVLAKSIRYSLERKKVQRQLEDSEKKYRMLFNASPLPMWVLDRYSLEFLNVNQAAIDLYGYSFNEFMQMTVRDLWAEGETIGEETWNDFKDDIFELKIKHRTKSGSLLYIDIQTNPIIFDGRKARVSLATNITEKIKAKEALLHSQRRFKALVQDGSDLISIINEDLKYEYISPSLTSILGWEPEELEGKDVLDYIHPDDREDIKNQTKNLGHSKSLQLPSYRYKNKKGEWRWLETLMSDMRDDPAVEGLVANSRDITTFIEQENRLKESLQRYDIVAKATSDLIVDHDIQKNHIKFNEAIFDIFGYKPEEIESTGEWWDSKIHPEDLKRVKALEKEMLEQKRKIMQSEYRLACADGTYKYILDRSYLLTDNKGRPERIIGSMQDITERHNYIQAIEESNKRLREIAWTQSHVVRAPLARIMGLIDLLKNNKENLENNPDILQNILISSKELDQIIRKIANQTEHSY